MSIKDDQKLKESVDRINKNSGDINFIFVCERYYIAEILKTIRDDINYQGYLDKYPELKIDVNDKYSRLVAARSYWYVDDYLHLDCRSIDGSMNISDHTFAIGEDLPITMRILEPNNTIHEFGERYYVSSRVNICIDKNLSVCYCSEQEYEFFININKIESVYINTSVRYNSVLKYNCIMLDGSKATIGGFRFLDR